MKRNNKKKGFTIVELVIVIAVIAILAAVLIPTFANVVEKANRSSALQACRNELVEMKAEYAARGGQDVAEGTIFSKGGFYFAYVDGALTECNKPSSGTATKLDNVEIYQTNAVEFNNDSWMTQKETDSVCAGVKFKNDNKAWTLKVYKDGSLFYSESGTSSTAVNTGCYFYIFANNYTSTTGTWSQKPASTDAAEGYYTYELTIGNETTSGIFYYGGK